MISTNSSVFNSIPFSRLQSAPLISPHASRRDLKLRRRTHLDRLPMRLAILIVVISSSVAGMAQLSSTGPQAFYDGQTVTAVDLIANPHRNVDLLRGSLVQKPGQPYSPADVEATISALQRVGGFEKVTVDVIPDISGLRLNFILEPAYYLGIVDFRGVPRSLSYVRLLQVVNLQDQDPYDQARLPSAETALAHFLQQD